MTDMKTMSASDLESVLDWAASEGWNPGIDDAEAFLAADGNGFFIASKDGSPVAAISVVNHSDTFAFLGLYICRPEFRGKGIGLFLWNHALSHAGDRVVGLDGVPDQQANYAKSGFEWAGETTRFTGTIAGQSHPDIRKARPADIAQLVDWEAEMSTWRKETYLSNWLSNTPHRKTQVLEEGGRITGFATVRSCRDGAKVGPLLAETRAGAKALLWHAATAFEGSISVDVPDTSPGLAEICKGAGMSAGFKTARMYRGSGSPARAGFYAVATLELG